MLECPRFALLHSSLLPPSALIMSEKCECGLTFNHPNALRSHRAGKEHRDRMAALAARQGVPFSSYGGIPGCFQRGCEGLFIFTSVHKNVLFPAPGRSSSSSPSRRTPRALRHPRHRLLLLLPLQCLLRWCSTSMLIRDLTTKMSISSFHLVGSTPCGACHRLLGLQQAMCHVFQSNNIHQEAMPVPLKGPGLV